VKDKRLIGIPHEAPMNWKSGWRTLTNKTLDMNSHIIEGIEPINFTATITRISRS